MIQLRWLDQDDRPLPRDGSGQQFIRLLGGPCGPLDVRLAVVGPVAVDQVVLVGSSPEDLIQVGPNIFARRVRSKRQREREPDAHSAAGTMTAVAMSGRSELGRSQLAVLPANFSSDEYHRMLLEIGLVAVSSASWVEAPVRAPIVRGSMLGRDGVGLASKGDTLKPVFDCVEAICKAFPKIERRPLRQVLIQRQAVPLRCVGRAKSGIRALVSHPSRSTVVLPATVEQLDSAENRFLRWLIERRLLPFLRVARTSRTPRRPEDPELQEMLDRAVSRNPELDYLAERLAAQVAGRQSVALRAEEAEQQLRRVLRSPFWKQVGLVSSPGNPTERMLGTPGYREVYLAYTRASWLAGPAATKGLRVAEAIVHREVRATWKCYETWCVSQLVRMFGELGGFRTRRGARALADLLVVNDGELQLPLGSSVELERGDILATISSEPSLPSSRDGEGQELSSGTRTLTPDIVVSIRRGVGERTNIVLDAKYRDYRVQGPKTIIQDLWKTALLKYKDGLSNAADPNRITVRSSFILHTDPAARGQRNDFWGGVPPAEWLRDIGLSAPATPPAVEVGGHSVGLVRLRPDEDCDFQLGRILDLWLQYLVPAPGFWCPRCGAQLCVGEDVRIERERQWDSAQHELNYILKAWREGWQTSVLCVCPSCRHYWFQNHCHAAGHPIFKAGGRSFHYASRQPWSTRGMYVCPTCGDDPPPERLVNSDRHRRAQAAGDSSSNEDGWE